MDDKLNNFLGNLKKELISVYGVPSSGKTCLCLLATLKHTKENKKVLFIDTEKSFSIERFKQMAGKDYKKYLEKIIFLLPKNFRDQHNKIKEIDNFIDKTTISLIIIDTISYYYRRFVKSKPELANSMLINQINKLKEISKKIPVILTNQVYKSIKDNEIKIIGGNILKNRSDRLIELKKEPRVIHLIKPEKKESRFFINNLGFNF